MLATIWLYVGFVLGLLLIVKGGDWFVDAASWVARVMRIPAFVVGATVVSLATTLPEVLVSTLAAAQGKTDLAIGNAVGSVIANTALIMAFSLVFLPVLMKRKQVWPKIALLLSAVVLLLILPRNGGLGVTASIPLFVIFALFILENLLAARPKATRIGNDAANGHVSAPSNAAEGQTPGQRKAAEGAARDTAAPPPGSEKDAEKPPRDAKTVALNIAKFVVGALCLFFGSRLLVDHGSEIARIVGIPERIIGLTFVAVGTSLPELVTTVTSLIKRQSALGVGNILGANIIDLTLILPLSAVVAGGTLEVSTTSLTVDLPVCLGVCVLMLVPTLFTQKFARWQGIACLLAYVGYVAYMFLSALPA